MEIPLFDGVHLSLEKLLNGHTKAGSVKQRSSLLPVDKQVEVAALIRFAPSYRTEDPKSGRTVPTGQPQYFGPVRTEHLVYAQSRPDYERTDPRNVPIARLAPRAHPRQSVPHSPGMDAAEAVSHPNLPAGHPSTLIASSTVGLLRGIGLSSPQRIQPRDFQAQGAITVAPTSVPAELGGLTLEARLYSIVEAPTRTSSFEEFWQPSGQGGGAADPQLAVHGVPGPGAVSFPEGLAPDLLAGSEIAATIEIAATSAAKATTREKSKRGLDPESLTGKSPPLRTIPTK